MSHSSRGGSIVELLNSLAPQTPVNEVVVDGYSESVNAFITLDRGLAYFSELGGGLVVADVSKISLVDFPGV